MPIDNNHFTSTKTFFLKKNLKKNQENLCNCDQDKNLVIS